MDGKQEVEVKVEEVVPFGPSLSRGVAAQQPGCAISRAGLEPTPIFERKETRKHMIGNRKVDKRIYL